MDLATIQAAFSSLSSAKQIAQSVLDIRDAALIREKIAEITSVLITAQSQTLSVQSDLTAAIEEIRQLKKRIVQMEDWSAEKQRYELREIITGVFAYLPKKDVDTTEPAHCLCAKCYNAGVKSILQAEVVAVGRVHLMICHTCHAELVTQGMRQDFPKRR